MEETTARAELPHLEIEIRHRRLPEEQAEYLSVSFRATPSFGAVGRYLEARNPALAWLAVTPFTPWARLMRAAWAPWLAAWPGLMPGAARPEARRGTEDGAAGPHGSTERPCGARAFTLLRGPDHRRGVSSDPPKG